jgi:hypothetical protein
MLPLILAAVGGYLIGDSLKKNDTTKFAEGGTIGDEGFTISAMNELLNDKFPYSFGFRVFPLKKSTRLEPNYDFGGSSLYGIKDSELKQKLHFPQYKRDHNINFSINQGDENTYFDFLLESENGDGYVGTFGFKDRGDVGKEYVTGFIVFLQEQYGLPFEIEHKVMADGGMMMADGGLVQPKYAHNISDKSVEDINIVMTVCEEDDAALEFNDSETIMYFDENELSPKNKKKIQKIFGDKMADGGIFSKRNLVRDRMFKSQQKWEQDYKRKSRPKNRRYMEDGGMMADGGMANGGRVNTGELEKELKEIKNKYPNARVSYSFAKDSTGKGYVITAKEGSKIVYTSYKY